MTRYPIEPLAAALHITITHPGRTPGTPGRLPGTQDTHNRAPHPEGLEALAQRLGTTYRTLKKTRNAGGWRHYEAERYAITAGLHPATIWPGWDRDIPDRLTDADWYSDDPPLDELDVPPPHTARLLPTLVA